MKKYSFEEIEDMVKNMVVKEVINTMGKKQYLVKINLLDHPDFTYTLSGLDCSTRFHVGDPLIKFNKMMNEGILGMIDLLEIINDTYDGRFLINFYLGDLSRYLYTRVLNEKDIKKEKLKILMKVIVRHELMHVHQFNWLKCHSSNYEKFKDSIMKVINYAKTVDYNDQEFEMQAQLFSLGSKEVKHPKEYMNQFLVA